MRRLALMAALLAMLAGCQSIPREVSEKAEKKPAFASGAPSGEGAPFNQ